MRRSTSQKKPSTKRWPCWHSAEQEKQNPPSLGRPRIISRPFSHSMRVWVRSLHKTREVRTLFRNAMLNPSMSYRDLGLCLGMRAFSCHCRSRVRTSSVFARRTSALAAVGVGSVIFQGTTPARGDARLPESVRVRCSKSPQARIFRRGRFGDAASNSRWWGIRARLPFRRR